MLTPDVLDEYARTYYQKPTANVGLEETIQRAAMPRILPHLRGRVLEMGYGTGLVTSELLVAGVDVEVVEGSPALADAARCRWTRLPVHTAMFEDFTPDRPYDTVLCSHVLEHVDDPVALLARVRDWLAPDGAVVVIVPNSESVHRRVAVKMGLQEKPGDLGPSDRLVGHQRVYSLETLSDDLGAAGFEAPEWDQYDTCWWPGIVFGYMAKTVPNSMMLDYPAALVEALVTVELDPELCANIGVRAKRR